MNVEAVDAVCRAAIDRGLGNRFGCSKYVNLMEAKELSDAKKAVSGEI